MLPGPQHEGCAAQHKGTRMKKYLCAAVVLAALTGCATKGTKFDMAQVEAMQPGVTTYDDAVRTLGKPYLIHYPEDGSRSAMWMWVQASLVGSQSRATRILFDRDGKMIRVVSKME